MTRLFSLGGALLLGLALNAFHALPADPPASTRAPGSQLADCMEGLKTNLKGLAIALKGEQGELALQHLAEMQRLVLLAKLESPSNLDQQAPGEREAHRIRFRRQLVLVLQELAGMELELLDGRFDLAFARVTGPLFSLRESAHEEFKRAE